MASTITGVSWPNNLNANLGPFVYTRSGAAELYAALIDATNNHLEIWRSTDNGDTWSEQDSANHKSISSTSGCKSGDAQLLSGIIYVAYISSSNYLVVTKFDCSTNAWGTTTSDGPALVATSDDTAGLHMRTPGSVAVFYLGVRGDGNYVILHQGPMYNDVTWGWQDRAHYSRYQSSTWTNCVALGVVLTSADHRVEGLSVLGDGRTMLVYHREGMITARSLSDTNVLDTRNESTSDFSDEGYLSQVITWVQSSTTYYGVAGGAYDTTNPEFAYAQAVANTSFSGYYPPITYSEAIQTYSANGGAFFTNGVGSADLTWLYVGYSNDDIYARKRLEASGWGAASLWRGSVTCQGIHAGPAITGLVTDWRVPILYNNNGTVTFDWYEPDHAASVSATRGQAAIAGGSVTPVTVIGAPSPVASIVLGGIQIDW